MNWLVAQPPRSSKWLKKHSYLVIIFTMVYVGRKMSETTRKNLTLFSLIIWLVVNIFVILELLWLYYGRKQMRSICYSNSIILCH